MGLIGAIIGAVVVFQILPDTSLSVTGTVVLDTATHEDARLDGAAFMAIPQIEGGRLYLRFPDAAAMNRAVGQTVTVEGQLRRIDIGGGQSAPALVVDNIH